MHINPIHEKKFYQLFVYQNRFNSKLKFQQSDLPLDFRPLWPYEVRFRLEIPKTY